MLLATVDSHGTALHHAAASKNKKQAGLVNMLLKHGAKIEAGNNFGVTPLHLAITHSAAHAAVALLEGGASLTNAIFPLKSVDDSGNTALHRAAASKNSNQAGLVNMLLQQGAPLEAVNKAGLTPLLHAMHLKNEPGALALLEGGAAVEDVPVSEVVRPPLHEAALRGLTLCVAHILERGFSATEPCDDWVPPISYAAMGDNVAVGELLLQHGASVDDEDDYGSTPLMYCRHKGFAELLLKHGADVDDCTEDGTTVLHSAVKSGDAELCKVLIQHGAPLDDVDEDGTLLFIATSQSENPAVCQVLIDAGAELDTVYAGFSPLRSACAEGQAEVVKMLLSAGAQLSVEEDQFTPLMLAAQRGHREVVRQLLDWVDVNEQGFHDLTALHQAARNGHPDVVKLLLQHGADKTLRDDEDDTALHCAYLARCGKSCQLLL